MPQNSTDLQPLQQSVVNAKSILVAIGQNPTHDAVAAGLALYLSFKSSGKSVEIACPSPMVVEFSRLVGLNQVKQEIGQRNLVVSFDYIQDSIEKVTYNVEDDKFNLVVQPKKGSQPLDSKNVSYSYSGAEADLVFVLNCNQFEDLGNIYLSNQQLFDGAYTISLGVTKVAKTFTQTSITDERASSISEIAAWLLDQIGQQATNDTASNLLAGIDLETNKFSSPNTPATAFAAAAKLMQNGAQRQTRQPRPKVPNLPPIPPKEEPIPNLLNQPMSVTTSQQLTPKEEEKAPAESEEKPQDPTPKDWLEPKIYQGSTKV